MMIAADELASWKDGAARRAVSEFVDRTVSDGVPAAERVAVFDNDGTLWCEKPMPIQADFILRRLAEMAQADPELRGRQPWKAAYDRDYGWLGTVLAEHYAGNDANVGTLLAGVLAAFEGISVEDFEAKSDAFLHAAQHPTLARGYLECAYAPMVELLGYLAAGNSNGDLPMLEFAQHQDKPSLRLLIRHDDGQREFDYTSGAEHALERAAQSGWTIVSMKDDWATAF